MAAQSAHQFALQQLYAAQAAAAFPTAAAPGLSSEEAAAPGLSSDETEDSTSKLNVPHSKRDRFVVRCLETGNEEEVITSQKYLATLRVGIPHRHPFGVSKRIIGPNGRNMKVIASMVKGAKIRLRGEGFQDKDLHQPLQLNISAHSLEGYVLAKALLMKLLTQVHMNFSE